MTRHHLGPQGYVKDLSSKDVRADFNPPPGGEVAQAFKRPFGNGRCTHDKYLNIYFKIKKMSTSYFISQFEPLIIN